jgi:flagellar basal body-associated protein FliL
MPKPTKRRKYLINPQFQIKWTFIITLVGVISAAVFATLFWLSINRQNALLEQAIESHNQLRDQSQDTLVLLMNMEDRTHTERQKYEKRFYELASKFDKSKEAKQEAIEKNKHSRYYVIAFVLLMGMCLFVWGIFLTHRVAGPLYVIRNLAEKLEKDGYIQPRKLRKRDEFKDVYQAVCDALEKVAGSKKPEA